VKVTDSVVVHTGPGSLSGTTLARSGDTLLCAFRAGRSRTSTDGRVRLVSSTDDGRTWTPVDLAWPVDGSTQVAGPHLGTSPDGTVVLAAAWMHVSRDAGAAAGIADAGGLMMRGIASAPVPVDFRRHDDEWAIPCGPPLALGGGRWLAPMERHAKVHVPEWLRGYHAFAAASDDDGRTWRASAPMMNDPDRRVAHYDQHIARTADGRIVSLAWAHDVVDDVTLPARAAWSQDEGATWTPPLTVDLIGGPVPLATLPDGRLFAAYPRRVAPTGIRAALSADNGRTWNDELVIWDESVRRVTGERPAEAATADRPEPLWDTMWRWTFGLPGPAVLADGSVGLVFYSAEPDGTATVRFVRITV
jgi:hypothetical protein